MTTQKSSIEDIIDWGTSSDTIKLKYVLDTLNKKEPSDTEIKRLNKYCSELNINNPKDVKPTIIKFVKNFFNIYKNLSDEEKSIVKIATDCNDLDLISEGIDNDSVKFI